MTHSNFIKENCPGGCPCDAYECEDSTPPVPSTEPVAKAVLLLNDRYFDNVPMVITYDGKLHLKITNKVNYNTLGEVDDDINFTYEENTGVYFSSCCAATLNDEMWVLGCRPSKRQVNFDNSYK